MFYALQRFKNTNNWTEVEKSLKPSRLRPYLLEEILKIGMDIHLHAESKIQNKDKLVRYALSHKKCTIFESRRRFDVLESYVKSLQESYVDDRIQSAIKNVYCLILALKQSRFNFIPKDILNYYIIPMASEKNHNSFNKCYPHPLSESGLWRRRIHLIKLTGDLNSFTTNRLNRKSLIISYSKEITYLNFDLSSFAEDLQLIKLTNSLNTLKMRNFSSCIRPGLINMSLERMLSLSQIQKITSLTIHHCNINDAGALQIAKSSVYRNLIHLDLSQNSISASGVKTLATEPSILSRLTLDENPILDEGVQEITDSIYYTQNLITLKIRNCGISQIAKFLIEKHLKALKEVAY